MNDSLEVHMSHAQLREWLKNLIACDTLKISLEGHAKKECFISGLFFSNQDLDKSTPAYLLPATPTEDMRYDERWRGGTGKARVASLLKVTSPA